MEGIAYRINNRYVFELQKLLNVAISNHYFVIDNKDNILHRLRSIVIDASKDREVDADLMLYITTMGDLIVNLIGV